MKKLIIILPVFLITMFVLSTVHAQEERQYEDVVKYRHGIIEKIKITAVTEDSIKFIRKDGSVRHFAKRDLTWYRDREHKPKSNDLKNWNDLKISPKFSAYFSNGVSAMGAASAFAKEIAELGYRLGKDGKSTGVQKLQGIIVRTGLVYHFHQNFNARLDFGISEKLTVRGFKYTGGGYFLIFELSDYSSFTIRNLIMDADLSIGINTTDQRAGLYSGFTLFKQQTRFDYNEIQINDGIGFHLGGYFRVINQDWGHLGLSSVYKHMPKVTLAPYRDIPETTVNPSHLNIQLFIGFNL